jgi:hypothetical protein
MYAALREGGKCGKIGREQLEEWTQQQAWDSFPPQRRPGLAAKAQIPK